MDPMLSFAVTFVTDPAILKALELIMNKFALGCGGILAVLVFVAVVVAIAVTGNYNAWSARPEREPIVGAGAERLSTAR